MSYEGTITRVNAGRDRLTLIVRTAMGLRGIEVEREVWESIRADYEIESAQELVGWGVEYDPEHGDLEIMGPPDAEDARAGADDHLPVD